MGGPMGVYQADRHPHLIAELRLIEHAVTNDLPIFGICLGSQLLAAALGANVRPQGTQEIGWKPVWRSDASDAVFGTLPDEISPLHWHGDVFDLPPGAVALARSEMTPLQAFRHGRHRYGVLFHLEVRAAELAGMAQAFPEELALGGPVLEEAPARLAHLRPLAERAFDAWIDSWSPADHLARSAPR
jgi:GMP synthase (glutamine-hydrolysing)